MSISIATAPARPASQNWQRDRAADELSRYVRTLMCRFAKHRPSDDPGCCRCGRLRPCAQEQRIAFLLELAGDARR